MRRIFASYAAGSGIKAVASGLTADGVPAPREPTPAGTGTASPARGQSAGRAILRNPSENGFEVWARQRIDEVLLDIDDAAAGHITGQRWYAVDQWQ